MEEYRKKRDFTLTPEPKPARHTGKGPLNYVIHKHEARHLHYDLRLEVDGVLKSWALPHGPSANPAEKRLAVMVEDHPIDYGSFEGVIPTGEYGAGQVIVWDNGTYSPERFDKFYFEDRTQAQQFAREGIEKGKLKFYLRGKKLQGIWTLVKMKNRGEKNWLLTKHQDEFAGTGQDILKNESSVLSGMTTADLKAGRAPEPPVDKITPDNIPGARKASIPLKIEPMLATLAKGPFTDPAWIYEPKLDGYRTIAVVNQDRIKLLSRHGLDMTGEYVYLLESLEKQTVKDMVLDGEVIALDDKGKSCFQCLQNYLKALREATARQKPVQASIIYYIFDILYFNGYDLTGIPLIERRKVLESAVRTDNRLRLIEQFKGDGEILFKAAIDNGLEGIIAKRQDSIYLPGRRSADWLKIKGTLSDEFVVGGYTQGAGNRSNTFAALLIGQYDKKGKLTYNGRVGTGFDEIKLTALLGKLRNIKTDKSPFTEKLRLTALTTWVKPELVVEVKYAERTGDGILRAPVFLRVREDKPLEEVRPAKTAEVLDPPSANPPAVEYELIKQLRTAPDKTNLETEDWQVAVSNLDKVLWPATSEHEAYTKRHLLLYFAEVSSYLLPHLQDRPLSFSRYPDGIKGEHFFQKHWAHPLPDFVKAVQITTEHEGTKEYMVCNNLATLLWLGQIADIELHSWFSRIFVTPDKPPGKDLSPNAMVRYPDFIIFDLDPYIYSGQEKRGEEPELNRHAFDKVCEVAYWMKAVLDNLSLTSFVKTSGKTGLHLFVPIKRQFTYDIVRSVARTICEHVNRQHPNETTLEWAVEKRTGKIFLDYAQNTFGKTLASAYSPRPNPEAVVSAPLKWDELGKVYPVDFTILNMLKRLNKIGDIWSDILESKHDLKKLIKNGFLT